MRIAEIFRSLQGEGRLTGAASVFIRASGCNLRCRFCDTRYASWEPEGDRLTVTEILAEVEKLRSNSPLGHVVVTGGEPMIFPDIVPLCQALRDRGLHITIETAGTCYLPVACDLMSISPKLANSTPPAEAGARLIALHERNRTAPDVLRRLATEYDCQFKFVVDSPADCREVLDYLAGFPEIDRGRVLLMPQGTTMAVLCEKAAWLEPYCAERGLTFCPRRHIEWYGCRRGT